MEVALPLVGRHLVGVVDQQRIEIGQVFLVVGAIAQPDQRAAQLRAVAAKLDAVARVAHLDFPGAFRRSQGRLGQHGQGTKHKNGFLHRNHSKAVDIKAARAKLNCV
ncbi:hypothetical protein D3C72_2133600 [compost metagenome]